MRVGRQHLPPVLGVPPPGAGAGPGGQAGSRAALPGARVVGGGRGERGRGGEEGEGKSHLPRKGLDNGKSTASRIKPKMPIPEGLLLQIQLRIS